VATFFGRFNAAVGHLNAAAGRSSFGMNNLRKSRSKFALCFDEYLNMERFRGVWRPSQRRWRLIEHGWRPFKRGWRPI
jgi:hypothetical protein